MRVLTLFAFLILPLAAMAQDNPILNRMEAFVRAYNAQDASAIAAFYTPDAALLPPKAAAIIGRDAIAAHYANAFAAGARDLKVKTFDIRPLGKAAAVEIGETIVMVGSTRIVGRYMHLWQVVEGQLLLSRDMYHVLKIE